MLAVHCLVIIFLLFKTVLSSDWIGCGAPYSLVLEVDNNKTIFIYDADIHIKYERDDLAIYDYRETDDVNILINNTSIFFSGQILEDNEKYEPSKFKISKILKTKIAGSAYFKKDTSTLLDCRLYLARNRKENTGDLSGRVKTEILHQASSCLRANLCSRLGKITHDDLRTARNNPYSFGHLSVMPKKTRNQSDNQENFGVYDLQEKRNIQNLTSLVASSQLNSNSVELQSTINVIVDLALMEIRREMRKESQGIIKIPDIIITFAEDIEWQPTGEFDAINGVFSDLTTLSRTDDAHLSHNGYKFILSCGFGISKAEIKYEKYKLKYGLKVSGNLSASIDGVALDATISVDYTQKPCRAALHDLRMTKLGSIAVKITGLSPLNGLMSKLITWVAEKWKNEIVADVQTEVKNIVRDQVAQFDCEKFRP